MIRLIIFNLFSLGLFSCSSLHLPKGAEAVAGESTESSEQASAVKSSSLPLEVKLAKSGIRLRLIPSARFTMGRKGQSTGDNQAYRVSLNLFYIGKFEVTQAQWKKVMRRNISTSKADNKPVENVTWKDCQTFLRRLEALEGFAEGRLALPTEAQWEYACRAEEGSLSKTQLKSRAWYYENSGDSALDERRYSFYNLEKNFSSTHEVGQKKANAFGLHDTYGNVFEWCSDWYGVFPKTPRREDVISNPRGAETGTKKVVRGGAWNRRSKDCNSTIRESYKPSVRGNNIGLRVVMYPIVKDKEF